MQGGQLLRHRQRICGQAEESQRSSAQAAQMSIYLNDELLFCPTSITNHIMASIASISGALFDHA